MHFPAGRPQLIGIVNITRDSFSDGGRFLSPPDALAHARRLRYAGADVIELGPASSHPDAENVTVAQEVERLAAVVDELVADGVPVSVDSFHPETQCFAAAHGARYLNDIQGFADPSSYEELSRCASRLVVMHSVQRLGPATRVSTDPRLICSDIDKFFDQRLTALEAAGIDRDRLIIDPGLGYFVGDTPEPSLAVMAGLAKLKERFGVPVLVSPSRKSFLRTLTGTDLAGIGPATLVAELYAACQGVDFIRTHDIAALHDALTILDALSVGA
jgi:dihydropteroate synthase type 2